MSERLSDDEFELELARWKAREPTARDILIGQIVAYALMTGISLGAAYGGAMLLRHFGLS